MRAAIYNRVSTPGQRRETTIETQIIANTAYCGHAGLRIVREYRDDGLSGTLEFSDRPGGRQLLADARAGLFDVVVVYDTSRLGRDDYAVITPLTVAYLRELGLEVHTAQGPLQDTPEGNLMLTLHSGLDAFYRANLARLASDGKRRAILEGRFTGHNIAYGYKVQDGRLVPDEDVPPGAAISPAEAVRCWFRWIADEGLSLDQVADRLNALSLPPPGMPRQRKWTNWRGATVARSVHRRIYTGVFVQHVRGEEYETHVPALVSEELFARAAERLVENRRFSGTPYFVYTVRDVLYCHVCGNKFHGHSCCPKRGGGRYAYYWCYGRDMRICHTKNLPARVVEQAVWGDVLQVARDPALLAERIAASAADASSAEPDPAFNLLALQQILAGKEDERNAILGLFRAKRIRQDALERQLAEIDAEEADVREKIALIEAHQETARRGTDALGRICETFAALSGLIRPDASPSDQQIAINRVVKRVTTTPDGGFHIEYRL